MFLAVPALKLIDMIVIFIKNDMLIKLIKRSRV